MITLKPQHQDTMIGKLQELVQSRNYHEREIAPYYNSMQGWERKEYQKSQIDTINEIEKVKNYIIQNEKIFNDILVGYGMSSITFIAKTIN